jgi:hypothetical protein
MGLMLHAAEDLLTLLRAERTGSAEDFEALLERRRPGRPLAGRPGARRPSAIRRRGSARSKSAGFGI